LRAVERDFAAAALAGRRRRVVFRAVRFIAVGRRAADLRVLLRAVFRVLLRAVVLRAPVFRAVLLRAVVFRVVLRALFLAGALFAADFLEVPAIVVPCLLSSMTCCCSYR
jgi:hypothetical protein